MALEHVNSNAEVSAAKIGYTSLDCSDKISQITEDEPGTKQEELGQDNSYLAILAKETIMLENLENINGQVNSDVAND